MGRRRGRIGEKVQVQNGRYKIDGGMLRIGIGNGEAKEHICMTHGHEQRGEIAGGNGGYWVEGDKGGKIGTTVIA